MVLGLISMEVSRLTGLSAAFHSFPCVKNRLFEWNSISLLVRDAAVGLHLHTLLIDKPTYVLGWMFFHSTLSISISAFVSLTLLRIEEPSQLCLMHPHFTIEF